MLGASAQELMKKSNTSATTCKERKLEDAACGYGTPSMEASSSASTSLSATASSSSDTESSWFSWMNGLNDIGRTWMENKLTEQGLALCEPANRETLLAFIEGSFADLLKGQESPITGILNADDDYESTMAATKPVAVVVNEPVVPAAERGDVALKADTLECVGDGYALHERFKKEEIVCSQASSDGVANDGVENVANAEMSRKAENQAESIDFDVCMVLEEPSLAAHGVRKMPLSAAPLFDDDKMCKQNPCVAIASSLPIMDSRIPNTPAATTMPKTPSRIIAPGKLLEASRRIFSKEEQSQTMLPRAPLQASSASKVNQPFKASFESIQSKIESPVRVFKLPVRKFLDRSRSIPSKEGSKLSSMSTLETQESRIGCGQGATEESNALHVREGTEGAFDDGPRFDEDLKVEEAQALVQSELRMLEVELDEVAAKLPKLEKTFSYQRMPVRSTSMPQTPMNASPKCNTELLSAASPSFMASSST